MSMNWSGRAEAAELFCGLLLSEAPHSKVRILLISTFLGAKLITGEYTRRPGTPKGKMGTTNSVQLRSRCVIAL